jgi:hypothetical protein
MPSIREILRRVPQQQGGFTDGLQGAPTAAPVPTAGPAPQISNQFTGQAPTEITATNRQTASMTPQQRAAWAAQNINSFDAQAGFGYSPEKAQAQWLAWDKHYDSNCPPNAPYRGRAGQCAESPDNCPEGTTLHGSSCIPHDQVPSFGAGGGAGGGGGAYGNTSFSGSAGSAGALPQFDAPTFTPPSYQDAMADPGYQFSLGEGIKGLEQSAAARGTLRTGGTLKDIIGYGQDRATQQYGDVYNRAANTFGINYQGKKDEFAPQYGGWQTMYGGDLQKYLQQQQSDLSRWQTKYGGDLSKYLQREGNIYGLLNQPQPVWD